MNSFLTGSFTMTPSVLGISKAFTALLMWYLVHANCTLIYPLTDMPYLCNRLSILTTGSMPCMVFLSPILTHNRYNYDNNANDGLFIIE